MAEPFLAEIRAFSFGFAPRNWALCNGQLLPINQNQALFALLGTTFGGNGQTNFALPDLRGSVPMHGGPSHVLGERAGQEAHTLAVAALSAARVSIGFCDQSHCDHSRHRVAPKCPDQHIRWSSQRACTPAQGRCCKLLRDFRGMRTQDRQPEGSISAL